MLVSGILPASADAFTTKLTGAGTATMKDGSIISIDSDANSIEEVEYQTIDSKIGAQNTTVYAKLASVFNVTIPKAIVLKGVQNGVSTATYKVDIDGDIAGNEYVLVEPEYTAKLHQNNKADVTMNIEQDLIRYRANNYTKDLKDREVKIATADDVIADGEGTGKVSAILTAGKWTGVFNFNIKLMEDNENISKIKITGYFSNIKNTGYRITYIDEEGQKQVITVPSSEIIVGSTGYISKPHSFTVQKGSDATIELLDEKGNIKTISSLKSGNSVSKGYIHTDKDSTTSWGIDNGKVYGSATVDF